MYMAEQPPIVVPNLEPIPASASSSSSALSASPASAAAAALQRRPVPESGLTMEQPRDYTDDEVDVDLRYQGIPFTVVTQMFESTRMIRIIKI